MGSESTYFLEQKRFGSMDSKVGLGDKRGHLPDELLITRTQCFSRMSQRDI
jgi:hypothetical protein